MTPSLRNLWLTEMWRTVPEWHQTKDEAEDAAARNALLNRPSTDAGELSTSGPESTEKGAA